MIGLGCHCWLVQQWAFLGVAWHCWASQQWHPALYPVNSSTCDGPIESLRSFAANEVQRDGLFGFYPLRRVSFHIADETRHSDIADRQRMRTWSSVPPTMSAGVSDAGEIPLCSVAKFVVFEKCFSVFAPEDEGAADLYLRLRHDAPRL